MDNFNLDVTSEGRRHLELALGLAFGSHQKATHYAVREATEGERETVPDYIPEDKRKFHRPGWKYGREPKPRRLVFYWSATENKPDLVALPFTLDAAGAVDFATRWLAEQDYGRQPDHDGDNGRGWRVYNEAWGHVDGDWGAFVAISPAWAMYGK